MNAQDNGRSELDAALVALEYVADYVSDGQDAFHRSMDRQLALVFLWANIGSHLKQYCRHQSIPAGTEPFASPIQMRDRLVYGSVLALDPSIVWQTCIKDGPELREFVSNLRSAL